MSCFSEVLVFNLQTRGRLDFAGCQNRRPWSWPDRRNLSGQIISTGHAWFRVPRRLQLNAAQTGHLLHSVAASAAAELLGSARLSAFFPKLARRLTAALKATRAQRVNAEAAGRHVLCAEALVEVLEARASDGRGRKGDSRGAIIDEYSALVPARLRAFTKRPLSERRLIKDAYPEVDLTLVRRALVQGDLAPELVAGVLEDPVSYRAFVRTLPPRPVR